MEQIASGTASQVALEEIVAIQQLIQILQQLIVALLDLGGVFSSLEVIVHKSNGIVQISIGGLVLHH